MILHFPILSRPDFVFLRAPGPGLGNLLFPLYRAYQNSRTIGGALVFPQFGQLKVGPFLRSEKDKRTYFELFKTRSVNDILLHMRALAGAAMIDEDAIYRCVPSPSGADVYCYAGLRNYFHDLKPTFIDDFTTYILERARLHQPLVKELSEITRLDICVHLRRGDFQAADSSRSASGGMCYRTEDDWYVSALCRARKRFPEGHVTVFTDETSVDRALMDQLGCDRIDSSRNALHALLKMAAHGAIVASRSSFSLWSAFLGRQFVYYPAEFDLTKYMPLPFGTEAV